MYILKLDMFPIKLDNLLLLRIKRQFQVILVNNTGRQETTAQIIDAGEVLDAWLRRAQRQVNSWHDTVGCDWALFNMPPGRNIH